MEIYIVVFALILLDVMAGLTAAFKNKEYKSTKMREGLYHKAGLMLCMSLGKVLGAAQGYLSVGFNVPVEQGICAYIALMEVCSIVENVCKVSPELVPKKLRSLMGIIDDPRGNKN